MLSVVGYHFVRDVANTKYPSLKARSINEFINQLEFIGNNYHVVTAEEVLAAVDGTHILPENSCWLTFDDGYVDHYYNVAPLLEKRRWQGSFFIPVAPIMNRELLDVNKIHLILDRADSTSLPAQDIRTFLKSTLDKEFITQCNTLEMSLETSEIGVRRWNDSPDTLFVKRVLQRAQPESTRTQLINFLFEKYVSSDPLSIAGELYVDREQVEDLISRGMYVGGHGNNHSWLSSLSGKALQQDIRGTFDFLKLVGAPIDKWIYSYPYGDYTDPCKLLLRQFECRIGLTNVPGQVRIDKDDLFSLKRLDTNDLPS